MFRKHPQRAQPQSQTVRGERQGLSPRQRCLHGMDPGSAALSSHASWPAPATGLGGVWVWMCLCVGICCADVWLCVVWVCGVWDVGGYVGCVVCGCMDV